MKTRETIGNLQDSNGQVKTENLEKAEILNKFFVSVFTKENLENIPNVPARTVKNFGTVEINIDIVTVAITFFLSVYAFGVRFKIVA